MHIFSKPLLTHGILILEAMLISWHALDKSIWWVAHLVIMMMAMIVMMILVVLWWRRRGRPPSHHDDGHDRHDDSDIGGDMVMMLVTNLVIIEVVTMNIIFDHIFEKNGKVGLFMLYMIMKTMMLTFLK